MSISLVLALIVVGLCSCEQTDTDGSCPVSNEVVDELKAEMSECSSKLAECRRNDEISEEGCSSRPKEADSSVSVFAFGVVFGVFATLAGIVVSICCCVFCDKQA